MTPLGAGAAWGVLVVAGLFEIAWVIGMKLSDGFTRLWPSVASLTAMFFSVALLAQAMRSIPVGTAYAVWTGIGAAGTAMIGIFWFSEPSDVLRLGSIVLIVAGIVGLKLVSP